MSSLHSVTPARHRLSRWRRYSDLRFAASASTAPLAVSEIAKAALSFPLAFTETDGEWGIAAVLGILPGQNLYVSPNGDWIASYIPAAFRSYPFRIGWNEAHQAALCVDESSGLVIEGGEGEVFFDETGNLGASLAQVWDFLQSVHQGEATIARVSRDLYAAGLIEPWPISVQSPDASRQVSGLNRINEAALSQLDDASFGQLRRSQAVGIAYAQLLSMGNLSDLGKLAQARAEAEAATRARAGVKPMIMLPEDSSIDWDWSKIGKS